MTKAVQQIAVGAMIAGINDVYSITASDLPWGKPERNVPELARKKAQGRNEQCKCGSGKKYKNCCGR